MGVGSADAVFRHLREAIIGGEYLNGQRITESEIASQLGLSRTPVREGLRRLEASGLLTIKPNVGATVNFAGERELFDLLGVRAVLESHAVSLAAERMTEPEIDELSDIATRIADVVGDDSMERDEKISLVSQMNVGFHTAVVQGAANATLDSTLQPLIQLALASRAYGRYHRLELERSSQHHLEIVDALREGDAEWAAAVMHAHLLAARRSMLH